MKQLTGTILALAFLSGPGHLWAAKFRTDDPIRMDPDRVATPQPTARELSKVIDLFAKTFSREIGPLCPSQNINTLGEVPDSSWFTNRITSNLLSVEELVRGPNQGTGPDMSEQWTIVGAKTAGVTPGFTIRDKQGAVYLIKFDPLQWRQMTTSAEVMGTKFFHAFGYNVPENYLVYWEPEYKLEEKAIVQWPSGVKEPLSEGFIRAVLKRVPRRPDGTIQVVASRLLPGTPLGGFDFLGMRPDDPNDLVPHQDRRELRGLRVLAAWLNHNDSDSVNTLDMYHTESLGHSYVKHYLIDFGTVMGSGATQPHARRVGHEYYIELPPSLKASATLGIWERGWSGIKYPQFRSIGRFEADHFRPELWKPDYPNPAFDKMTVQDAFWAARIVSRFSDEMIRAIVGTGELDEEGAEDYLFKVLIERRNRIVRHYFSLINPLDEFEIRRDGQPGHSIQFSNLGMKAGLASRATHRYAWYRFDNDAETLTPLPATGETEGTSISIPQDGAPFLMLRLTTDAAGQPRWTSAVDVYLRNDAGPFIVGIERADPAP